MPYIVLSIGALLSAVAVLLIWRGRKSGIAPLLGGIALILFSGTSPGALTKMKLSLTGLDVAFKPEQPAKDEKEELERRALSGVSGAILTPDTGNYEQRATIEAAAPEFVDFYRALGVIPTSIVGADTLTPGSVIYFEAGRPILFATPGIAFPGVVTDTKETVVPEAAFSLGSHDPLSRLNRAVKVRCDDARISFVSEAALKRSISPDFLTSLTKERTLFVVGSTLQCGKTDIGVSSDNTGSAQPDRSAAEWRYVSDKPSTIGYTLFKLTLDKAT